MNDTIENLTKKIIASIAILCLATVAIPSASAGIIDGIKPMNNFKDIHSVQESQNNRITKIDALGTKIEWNDVFTNNQWIPKMRSFTLEPAWKNLKLGSIQWKDQISNSLNKYSPSERTVTLEPAWKNFKLGFIQWNDKILENSKKYSPSERTVAFEPGWKNVQLGSIQWKDMFSDNLKKPLERTISIGPSWAKISWDDKFNGFSYSPSGKNIKIGDFKWTGTFNGKSYVPQMNPIIKPMPMPRYSTIPGYH